MSVDQRAVDQLFWNRIVPNQIVHLSADEKVILQDPNSVSQMKYYGVIATVGDSLHAALAEVAAGNIETAVGVRKVGVDHSQFAPDAAGCCDLAAALSRVHPKKLFIIMPREKVNTVFLDLVRARAVNCRIVIVD